MYIILHLCHTYHACEDSHWLVPQARALSMTLVQGLFSDLDSGSGRMANVIILYVCHTYHASEEQTLWLVPRARALLMTLVQGQ